MTDHPFPEIILWRHPWAILAIAWARRVCYANRAARQFLGATDTPIEGCDVVKLFGGNETLAHAIDQAIDDRGARRIEFTYDRAETQVATVMTLSPCLEGATVYTMILSFRDLGERRLITGRMEQVERLESAERLVGGFAHQLRNPLAAVSALIENLVAEMPSDDPRTEYTNRLQNQISNIDGLIRACLEFGGSAPIVRQRSTAKGVAYAAVEEFKSRRGVAPRFTVVSGTRDVVVCEAQIARCLALLLESALDATGDVSKVSLEVSPEPVGGGDRFVRFEVRDQGLGIEQADLDLIFEPFYTTKARGVGVGLAAAQALAIHNGGAL